MKSVRVMTYNVYQGGGDRFSYIKELISKVKPDVLAIQEACDWDQSGRFLEVLDLLGFDRDNCWYLKSNARSTSGRIYDMAFFSKYPIETKEYFNNQDKVWHSLGFAVLNIENARIGLVMAHLSPKSEDWRLVEVNQINQILKENINLPLLLLGDLNSLSDQDPYDSLQEKLQKEEIIKFGVPPRFEVVNKFINAGWIDKLPDLYYPQNPLQITVSEQADDKDHLDLRLDYIMINKVLVKSILKYQIIRDKIALKASDHYPVAVDLNI